ncbi:hypothetical protein N7509_012777 [Penicillium cosmopolitanum]|uniref:Uncharacterized protein n=1 Tax=Penicillium cosmopolitanum TaxID=1131564 RepID=A0A9W9SC41_9EURO|nr:uncharacterized protein N7509_012777 [Penicillium cosmopolitanum]KAJ5375891.1 hypothetical protein N7509_012777 [Penicillium cosmopolitanum]
MSPLRSLKGNERSKVIISNYLANAAPQHLRLIILSDCHGNSSERSEVKVGRSKNVASKGPCLSRMDEILSTHLCIW